MSDRQEILLVYDKDCPACHYYCQLAQIRESVGDLTLVDAREPSPIMDEITALGLDIDEGMVLKVASEIYYGSDAINMLSILGTRSGFINRIAYYPFRSRRLARVLYPILKTMRNLLLKLLGRTRINNLRAEGRSRF